MGPNLQFHLAGGQGGIQHFMEQFTGPLTTWWKDLGMLTDLSSQVKQTIVDGVLEEAANRSIDQLSQEEDEVLLGLLRLRTRPAEASTPAKKTV
jgi:hypothetical protein